MEQITGDAGFITGEYSSGGHENYFHHHHGKLILILYKFNTKGNKIESTLGKGYNEIILYHWLIFVKFCEK